MLANVVLRKIEPGDATLGEVVVVNVMLGVVLLEGVMRRMRRDVMQENLVMMEKFEKCHPICIRIPDKNRESGLN